MTRTPRPAPAARRKRPLAAPPARKASIGPRHFLLFVFPTVLILFGAYTLLNKEPEVIREDEEQMMTEARALRDRGSAAFKEWRAAERTGDVVIRERAHAAATESLQAAKRILGELIERHSDPDPDFPDIRVLHPGFEYLETVELPPINERLLDLVHDAHAPGGD